MFLLSFILLFVNLSCSLGNSDKFHNSTGNILCRACGSNILHSDDIIFKVSPSAEYSFNDTLFNKDDVLVQLLAQNYFIQYPVITSSKSNCVTPGEWEEDEVWFPGYDWKPCFCPDCGMLMGWVFQRWYFFSGVDRDHDNFFALVLLNLISEDCNCFFIGDFGGMCSSSNICSSYWGFMATMCY